MDVLFFGYVRTWALLYAGGKRRTAAEKCVKPARADTLARLSREFADLLAQHGASPAGPITAMDRLALGFDEQSWADFLKKSGFDEEDQKHED